MYLWDIKQVFGLLTKIGLEAAPAACCLLVAIVISFGRYLTHRLNTPRKEEGKDATDMKTHSDDIRGQRKAEPGQSVRRQRDRRKKFNAKETAQHKHALMNGGGGEREIRNGRTGVFWGRRNGNAGDKHATGKGQKSALWGVANRKSFNQRKRKKKRRNIYIKKCWQRQPTTHLVFISYLLRVAERQDWGNQKMKSARNKCPCRTA